MSADPITVDSGNGGGPVDHHRPEGREITRRTLLKTGAAAGAAMSMGAIPTDTVNATHDGGSITDPDLVHYGVAVASPASFVTIAAGEAIFGALGSAPDTSDRLTLHKQAVTQMESWEGHFVQFQNRLTDASTVADIEARDGIARSYEHGATANEALTNALARIRSYYADAPEHNAIEIANKTLLSYRAIQHAGDQTDPVFTLATGWQNADSSTTGQIVFYPDGNADLSKDDPGLTSSTVTLHDGSEHTVGVGVQNADDNPLEEPMTPKLEVYDDSYYADGASKLGEFTPLSDEVLDAYDDSADEFVFTLDDGTEVHTKLRFTIPPITDSEGTQLRQSEMVFDLHELVEILTEINDQSDTIVANYDETFVSELFALMDDGTIDPNDIRGSAGMARFLSGTDDASESRFRLALMQQFGMERSDLSNVASMDIDYTGYTAWNVDNSSETRRELFPAEHVESESYSGQLFGYTSTSLKDGETYDANPFVFAIPQADPGHIVARSLSGNELWRASLPNSGPAAAAYSPSAGVVAVPQDFNNSNEIYGFDATDGERLWTATTNQRPQFAEESDGTIFIADQDQIMRAYDAADGSSKWSYTNAEESLIDHKSSSLAVGGGTAVIGTDNNGFHAVDTADGSQKWSEATNSVPSAAVAAGYVFVADGSSVRQLDADDGTEAATYDALSSNVAAMDGDEGRLVVASTDEIHVLDAETLEAQSTFTISVSVNAMEANGGYVTTANSDSATVFDLTSGEQSNELSTDALADVAVTSTPGADGVISGATMFDAPAGEDRNLINGTVTVTKITDADGNELDSSDYNEPDYDTYDSQEYAEYVEEHVTYKETIYREEESGPTVPCLIGCGDGDGGDWIGLVIIGAIILMVVGWVTDLLPFVGGD